MAAFFCIALVLAAPSWGAASSELPVAERLAHADELRKEGKLQEALAVLEKGRSDASDDAAVLWRLARVHVDRGNQASGDERVRRYEKARAYADEATTVASDDPNAHLWLAISLGKLAELTASGRDRLALAVRIEEEATRTLELDPGRGEALYMLASIRYEMAQLPWYQRTLASLLPGTLPEGSLGEARQLARMAVDVSPETIRYRLLLAKVLVAQGEQEGARQVLEELLELPVRTPDESRQRERALELVAEL